MGAFGGSIYSSGPSSTHSFRENELVDKILLCCKLACRLVKLGVWAMAEVSQWNIFLNDEKGSSYHDTLLLWERLYLEEHCVPC